MKEAKIPYVLVLNFKRFLLGREASLLSEKVIMKFINVWKIVFSE